MKIMIEEIFGFAKQKHKTLNGYKGFLFLVFIFFTVFLSCRRDDFYEGDDIVLQLSTDTLRFDTVFTSVGSATRWVKVFNPESSPVLVDFELKNKSNSYFRINVDGVQGPTAKGIEIGARDSVYVFVEVTINPDQPLSISPFIVEDQISVSVNGRNQIIYLEAFGQNANYIPGTIRKGSLARLTCNLGTVTWNDPKPYVIYGVLYIDSCHLVIPANTKIYVHGGVIRRDSLVYNDGLIVFQKDGRLTTLGTPEAPVIFQADRLEPAFSEASGQWVGLLFTDESKNHSLTQTTIKNSIIGLRADSLSSVRLDGCRIFNTSASAVIARHAEIYGENCLFYNNGGNGLQLVYGGNYTFNYCTVASFSGRMEAVVLTDFFCRDIFCSGGPKVNQLNASFTNCIFTGNDKDEITLASRTEGRVGLNYKFENCIVKVADILLPSDFPDFLVKCNSCINLKGTERLFNDRTKLDFSLDTMSVALTQGIDISGINLDITGKFRKSPNPDPGCYEL